jgi:hypothetical protein
MIVAFVGHHEAIALALVLAELDDSRVLTGTEDYIAGLGGKILLEQTPAALVRAVLAPHDVEDRGLDFGGIAADEADEVTRFRECQSEPVAAEIFRDSHVRLADYRERLYFIIHVASSRLEVAEQTLWEN